MPAAIPVPPALRGRPFRLDEAISLGLTPKVLHGQRFRRVRRGVYAEAALCDDVRTRADAALLVLPAGAVLSHATAAELRGLPVTPSERIHVRVAGRESSEPAGIRCHRRTSRWAEVDGRRLSTPADNFVELAASFGLVALVVLGDAMVRRGLVSCAELVGAALERTRRRGRPLAARASPLVRERVDSPMESVVRMLLVLAGLPEPVTNYVVRDASGGWIGAVDLAYPALRIAIEYHGDVHRTTRGQWRSDVRKAELLRELGWTVIILTAADLSRPTRLLDRVCAALRASGGAVPDEFSGEWERHLADSVNQRPPWI